MITGAPTNTRNWQLVWSQRSGCHGDGDGTHQIWHDPSWGHREAATPAGQKASRNVCLHLSATERGEISHYRRCEVTKKQHLDRWRTNGRRRRHILPLKCPKTLAPTPRQVCLIPALKTLQSGKIIPDPVPKREVAAPSRGQNKVGVGPRTPADVLTLGQSAFAALPFVLSSASFGLKYVGGHKTPKRVIPDVVPVCPRCCRGPSSGAAQSGLRGVGFTGQIPPMSDICARPVGVQGHSGVIGHSNDLTLKTDAEW